MEFYGLMALRCVPSHSKADSVSRNNVDKPRIESSFNVFIYLYTGEYMCLCDWLSDHSFFLSLFSNLSFWHFPLYGNVRCLFSSFSPIGQKWDYFIGSQDSVMGWRKRHSPGYFRREVSETCFWIFWALLGALTPWSNREKSNQSCFLWLSKPQGGTEVSDLYYSRYQILFFSTDICW